MLLWNLQVQAGVRLSHNSIFYTTLTKTPKSTFGGKLRLCLDTGDERWGYSSGEEDDDSTGDPSDTEPLYRSGSEMDSYPPSPSATLLCCHLILFSEERRG